MKTEPTRNDHTPTPGKWEWELGQLWAIEGETKRKLGFYRDEDGVFISRKADADYIVKAVNNYSELINVCNLAIEYLEGDYMAQQAVKSIRKVIAKAEGK